MVTLLQPEGVETVGVPLMSSQFLTSICLAFYDMLFTILLSVLP